MLAVAIGLVLFASCSANDPSFNDAEVVMQYIVDEEAGPGGFSFSAGPYQGGTAVLSKGGLAFWVKDGVGYAVNDAASEAAPDIEKAPENVQLDDAFKMAANQ